MELLEELIKANESLRKPNGMFVASNGPHYCNFSWIRDIYYQAKPSLKIKPSDYIQTYDTLTEYILGLDEKYDNKLKWLVEDPQVNSSCFIHPRFHHASLTEITAHWGNIQIDVFGYYILAIAEAKEKNLLIKNADKAVIELIKILDAIEYWKVEDNGIWEEASELHASSIGGVVGALKRYSSVTNMKNDLMIEKLIKKGEKVLKDLLPRESVTKKVDLALLTLIYPFGAVDTDMAKTLVKSVSEHLERDMGVIRYYGDAYYNNKPHAPFESRIGEECEWCMGFAFLAHAHKILGNETESIKYYNKCVDIHEFNGKNGLPEGYYGGTKEVNDNSSLGWPTGMLIDYIKNYITG